MDVTEVCLNCFIAMNNLAVKWAMEDINKNFTRDKEIK